MFTNNILKINDRYKKEKMLVKSISRKQAL
ncbi:hypothetical protein SAMN05216191_101235 [Paenibacillus jilunlii]|uniref:Uncharacterized protein n=1 Tax=Paenibacillus jilunlii TaxID=682956 RepID=A0A1G9G5Q5_9BACL|nr:hypothetical protein SAMN05216191_101235 [Paenibacillus jilunlii]